MRFTKPCQPLDEPSFLRRSGAHGPSRPASFSCPVGVPDVGSSIYPMFRPAPPPHPSTQSHCQSHSSHCTLHCQEGTNAQRRRSRPRTFFFPPATFDQETAAQRSNFLREIHPSLLSVHSLPNSCPLMRGK